MRSHHENSNYWRESLLEVIRQNIAGWCQQAFCFQKFVDKAQQYFAFTPQTNFPNHNLNFHWKWRDWLPFEMFSTLSIVRQNNAFHLFQTKYGCTHAWKKKWEFKLTKNTLLWRTIGISLWLLSKILKIFKLLSW